MRDLELTPRLRFLADRVPPGARLADVGTDHAYLPVWLRLHRRVVSAIACDLREGPLSRARETGQTWGVNGVEYRLGNGLEVVSPEEADTIVIAGMGGENIAAILSRAPWTAGGGHTLLLQPQSKAEVLRGFLAENGYVIRREALVEDRGTLYPVMEAGGGKMSLTLGQLYGGAALLHDPLGDRYIVERIIRLQIAVAGINRSGGSREKGEALREIITALLFMREERRRAKSQ